jgi:hypothetical protein
MAIKTPVSLARNAITKVKDLFHTSSSVRSFKNFGKSIEHRILKDLFTIAAMIAAAFTIMITGILFFQFILIILNKNAYITPKNLLAGGGDIPVDCQGDPGPPPTATGVLFSSDNRFAFPMTPFADLWYGCSHWRGNNATDIGFIGDIAAPPNPGRHTPIVAYTSGTIDMVVLNDSLGGKYIILQGDDGRFYYYAHNCQLYVKAGDRVTAGQVIAASDNTGDAATTVEHLHFAINSSDWFYMGAGDVCPASDFKVKFNLNYCDSEGYCLP